MTHVPRTIENNGGGGGGLSFRCQEIGMSEGILYWKGWAFKMQSNMLDWYDYINTIDFFKG